MLALKKALADARSLYNLIRLQGDYRLAEQLDFQKLNSSTAKPATTSTC